MAIDVQTPESPGWWMVRCAAAMNARRVRPPALGSDQVSSLSDYRLERMQQLWNYYTGEPPLPVGAEACRPIYAAIIRRARMQYAELVVDAMLHRLRMLGVRSGSDHDVDGDNLARDIAAANDLGVQQSDLNAYTLTMGDGYVIVGEPDESGFPVITVEDPRTMVSLHDPARTRIMRAAMKVYRDDDRELDTAHLYLPGATYTVTAPAATLTSEPVHEPRAVASMWTIDDTRSGPLPSSLGPAARTLLPVYRFRNRKGQGEFESNVDLLNRINDTILRRIVLITLQAFRQRGVKGDLPEKDEHGKKIDYDAIFSPDPGSLWHLPPGIEMWESAQADLTPILAATRDDVKELAAVTMTPLHLITPDAASGSAEGASTMREAHVHKCAAYIDRTEPPWLRVYRAAYLIAGDTARATGPLSGIWAPVERFSLAERADAAVKAKASGLPQRTIYSDIWGYGPKDLQRLEAERLDDLLLAPPAPGQAPQIPAPV